jgi:hypothetical protein
MAVHAVPADEVEQHQLDEHALPYPRRARPPPGHDLARALDPPALESRERAFGVGVTP